MPVIESMLNKWDYSGVDMVCFSDVKCESYKKAAEFIGKDSPVEDWGGGTGWARMYFTNYKNIDGSPNKYVDVIADLVKYTSRCENILMRQVLEYNWEWKRILTNVKKSFSKRFCLIIMTPLVAETKIDSVTAVVDAQGISKLENETPDIFFKKEDILAYFPESEGYKISEETIETVDSLWGHEWILYVQKV